MPILLLPAPSDTFVGTAATFPAPRNVGLHDLNYGSAKKQH